MAERDPRKVVFFFFFFNDQSKTFPSREGARGHIVPFKCPGPFPGTI